MRITTALLAATLPLPATGQVQLLPAGEFAARDGRPGKGRRWRVDDAQGARLAQAMNATAARTPIVIDYEHQTLHAKSNGQWAPAAGWMPRVEWLAGKGLFADADWTERARSAIKAGEYRYLSPVISWDEDSGAVVDVHLAALTNFPALLGMDAAVAALNTTLPHNDGKEPDMELLTLLLARLGLAADTKAEAALDAVAALKTKADAKPSVPALPAALTAALAIDAAADEGAALAAVAKLKAPPAAPAQAGTTDALTGLITALQAQVTGLGAELAEGKLTAQVDGAIAAGKFAPALREQLLAVGRKDAAMLTSMIGAATAIPGLSGQSGGGERGGAASAALAADAEALRSGFGLTKAQFDAAAPRAH